MAGIVRVVVMMATVRVIAAAVGVLRPDAGPQPLAQHRCADYDDEEPRRQREPGVELLGDDEPRQHEGHETEPEDTGRVGQRHRRSQQEGVPRLSLRADEVAGDECLAVARRQRVHGSPERGDQEGEQDDAEREVAAPDQRLEAAAAVVGCGGAPDRRRGGGRERLACT